MSERENQIWTLIYRGSQQEKFLVNYLLVPILSNSSLIYIRFDEDFESTGLHLYQSDRREVWSRDHINRMSYAGDYDLAISGLTQGIYYLRVKSRQGAGVEKIVGHGMVGM